jgi:hypothetical protein
LALAVSKSFWVFSVANSNVWTLALSLLTFSDVLFPTYLNLMLVRSFFLGKLLNLCLAASLILPNSAPSGGSSAPGLPGSIFVVQIPMQVLSSVVKMSPPLMGNFSGSSASGTPSFSGVPSSFLTAI